MIVAALEEDAYAVGFRQHGQEAAARRALRFSAAYYGDAANEVAGAMHDGDIPAAAAAQVGAQLERAVADDRAGRVAAAEREGRAALAAVLAARRGH